ncbi:MAG: Hydroxyacylglutathione hydrolase GloB [Candidatus Celerinatantimonas neptuna]|nr:MAG: Hydroxyacylglutathione hydrolase GloB [Candidatus Celerinatantimonas neptuna]
MQILTIPAFNDNYIWLLHNPQQRQCAVIDPGQADTLLKRLGALQANLSYILLTHHHQDHIGGVEKLLEHYPECKVYANSQSSLPFQTIGVESGQSIELKALDISLEVISTPGHTSDHVTYYDGHHLFCGDTLFNCGCGRLFEGTAEQMINSLEKIASLPTSTQIYSAHEYTLSNLKFALTIEPENKTLQAYQQIMVKQRQQGLPTIPFDLASQLDCNPFLRCQKPSVKAAVEASQQSPCSSEIDVFAGLRQLKDRF